MDFNFGKFGTADHCGKDTRKYLYFMAGLAVFVLLSTYIYEYHYLPSKQKQQQVAAVNQPQGQPVQFAGPMAGMGMNALAPGAPPAVNVAAPPVPPVISRNATPPGNHQQDGRAQMNCTTCHQIQGANGAAVAFANGQANNSMTLFNPGAGMTVAAPGMPPTIPHTATPPANHQQDGRAKMVCSSCHQVTGANGQVAAFQNNPGMMLPVDNPPPQNHFHDVVLGLKGAIVSISASQGASPVAAAQGNAQAQGPSFANPFTGVSTESIGSGVVVSRNGYIVTNNHVVRNSTGLMVTVFTPTGSKRYRGEIVKLDETQDLALLKISPDELLKPAPLGDSSKVQVADSVITIGSPFGLDLTVSRGIIAGLRRAIVIDNVTHDQLIQTDAAINQGNSGGAMVNRDGEVIGINTAIYTPTGAFSGIGFAIPINKVKVFMQDSVKVDGMAPGQGNAMQMLDPLPVNQRSPMPGMGQPGMVQPGMGQPGMGGQAGNCMAGQVVAMGQGGCAAGVQAQTIAAQQGPPIQPNAPIPGNHKRDGRGKVACESCHAITGGGKWQGQLLPAAMTTVAAQQGPPIQPNAPIPGNHKRDGRGKVACESCHAINGGGKWQGQLLPAAFGSGMPQNVAGGGNALLPFSLGVAQQGAAVNPAPLQLEGAVLEPLTDLLLSRINAQVSDGAFVSSVYPSTPAERAGLQAGDIIFKLEGRWVMTPEDLLSQVGNYRAGENLRLGVYSGGQRRNLYLVLGGQGQQ
ncbi:trypsin-like peptidase domain-containing protein [Magnetovirga frankeli]|uniref:trypsin-like peptidase domain-containing protein n=1 Tax=Magnetovirga frankeli TaxID=947516 RepID=UPI000456C1F0|nr:magnetosome protein [gamma proteobacterium SS-5]QFY89617.1 trypsin-like peptidase domain-containing protein [gamma proteobacterium SS-5]